MLLTLTNKNNDKVERSWKIVKIQEVDGGKVFISLYHSWIRTGNPDKSEEIRNQHLCLFLFDSSKGKQNNQ